MRRVVLSTDSVPEAERFSYWREEIGERLFGFASERSKDEEAPFAAQIVVSIWDCCVRIRVRADRCAAIRGSREIAHIGWEDYVALYSECSLGNRWDVDRREFVTQRGDLLVGDPTLPYGAKPLVKYDSNIWYFPRKLFDPHLPASLHPRFLVLEHGLSGIVKAYLDGLAAQIDALGDKEIDLVANNFCRLLAVACGAEVGEQPEAIRQARLAEARRYIDLHLADPALSPEKAAAALKISLRQLHLLFEPSGESFARHVTRRRLEECRAALLSPTGDRPVTDIAFAWGFGSLETFNRTFRRAFGASQSELRSHPLPSGGAAGARILAK